MESLSVRFLYSTLPGRAVLKVLVNPKISRVVGAFLDSPLSKIFIPYFKKSNNITLDGIIIPEKGFNSFNAFFSRKRKALSLTNEKAELISPCDAYLSCMKIRKNTIFDIKHTKFTVGDMLRDKELAREYEGGCALIFRLTPAHYHRYCYPADGIVVKEKKIPGILHCVRPIVTRQIPVYTQNAREYQVIKTEQFGNIVQMEVGALMVGRITNHKNGVASKVRAGREKGYFEFGGSTIVLLLKKDRVVLSGELKKMINEDGEIPVSQGMVIGRRK